MRKPLIGITCGRYADPHGDMRIVGTRDANTHTIEQAGGLPTLIPPDLDEDTLRDVYARLDGVLLTGGADVDASFYGMQNENLVKGVDRDRDATEIAIARWAAANDKPLLGICRGCQVANVALGGTLWRDLPAEYPNALKHDLWNIHPRNFLGHGVQIKPHTRLAHALGENNGGDELSLKVNSLHHQGLRDIAPKLAISACATDGVVEGIEIPTAKFYIAVQWHPEEMTDSVLSDNGDGGTDGLIELMRHLFEQFVEAARPR